MNYDIMHEAICRPEHYLPPNFAGLLRLAYLLDRSDLLVELRMRDELEIYGINISTEKKIAHISTVYYGEHIFSDFLHMFEHKYEGGVVLFNIDEYLWPLARIAFGPIKKARIAFGPIKKARYGFYRDR